MVAEDSATEVGSIGSRHKATTVDHTPAPASLQDVSEKQPVADETTEQIDELKADGAASHDADEGIEYPVAWKLGLITISLCLSVFCVALVRHDPFRPLFFFSCHSVHELTCSL